MVLKVFGPGVVRISVGFGVRLLAHPKKNLHPLGSEIFQPKAYSWEPLWYFGSEDILKESISWQVQGFRGAGGVWVGGCAPPMQQE